MFCVVVDKVHSLVCIRQVISWLDVGNLHQCLITQITQSPAFLKGKSHIKIMCAWSPVRHYQWTELHCFLNVGRMSLVWWSFTEPIILPLLILHGHWCITISQRKWKNQPTQLAVFFHKNDEIAVDQWTLICSLQAHGCVGAKDLPRILTVVQRRHLPHKDPSAGCVSSAGLVTEQALLDPN